MALLRDISKEFIPRNKQVWLEVAHEAKHRLSGADPVLTCGLWTTNEL